MLVFPVDLVLPAGGLQRDTTGGLLDRLHLGGAGLLDGLSPQVDRDVAGLDGSSVGLEAPYALW